MLLIRLIRSMARLQKNEDKILRTSWAKLLQLSHNLVNLTQCDLNKNQIQKMMENVSGFHQENKTRKSLLQEKPLQKHCSKHFPSPF